MTPEAAKLLAEALALPKGERAELAARLLESLEPAADTDVEEAWAAEIKERLEQLGTGQEQPIPWPEARRMIMEDVDEPDEG
jgi:putative addiction module component (TIGR02574 family)